MFDLVAAVCSYAVVAVAMFLILWQRTWADRGLLDTLSVYFGALTWSAATWGYTALRYGAEGLMAEIRK
jgi:hypothetical protein